MDSLASLALSTEPPSEELLNRPPINRSASMLTKQMYFNMLGQGAYQAAICLWILFAGPAYFGVPEGTAYLEATAAPSQHHTILFNCLVLMTLVNEVNCRKLDGEFNVFKGVLDNPWFVSVLSTTFVLQCLVTQYGGYFFKCYVGGLTASQWGFCLVAALSVLVWQQIVNVCAYFFGEWENAKTPGGKGEGGCLKFKSCIGNGKFTIGSNSSWASAKRERRISQNSRDYGKSLSGGSLAKAKTAPQLNMPR